MAIKTAPKTRAVKTGAAKNGATSGTTASGTGQSRTASPGARPRSAAANRAYARRAQRTAHSQKLLYRTHPVRQPVGSKSAVNGKAAAKPRTKQAARTKVASVGASTASFVVLLMGLLVVGVGATLWLSTQATADSYKLERLKDTTTQLGQQREQLQQQVAQADSATSLADRAKQMGMVPANDPAHLVVGKDGKVKVIGKPSPAKAPKTDQPTPPEGGAPQQGQPADQAAQQGQAAGQAQQPGQAAGGQGQQPQPNP